MKEYIFIKKDKSLIKIFLLDILYVRSNGDYVIIHTSDIRYTVLNTMNNIEKLLGDRFCRIHNETIIQLREIVKIEESDSVLLSNGAYFSISRARMKHFKDQLIIV